MRTSSRVKRQASTSASALDDEIAVGQHGALGAPGGAGGVEEGGEVVVAALDGGERGRRAGGARR